MKGSAYLNDGRGAACPKCDGSSSFVLDSRPHNGVVLRRRECRLCSQVYVTQETTIGAGKLSEYIRDLPIK